MIQVNYLSKRLRQVYHSFSPFIFKSVQGDVGQDTDHSEAERAEPRNSYDMLGHGPGLWLAGDYCGEFMSVELNP